MKSRTAVLAFLSLFLASWSVPSFAQTYGESPYIFGMHEPGGESHMADKGRKGWILFTEELGHDAANSSGGSYRPWADGGFGVLVRLNNGYGTNGTLPYERHHDAFAQRVANFVANAPGAHIWIVGNEPNLAVEWPSYEGPVEQITPQRYASCFRKVRDKIKTLPGHGGDQVLMAGMSPASSGFTYHSQTLAAIGAGNVDGFAIHCYTAGSDPGRIQLEFRDYRSFLGATPTWARSLPAYITETDEGGPWTDANTGWVKAAYAEIDAWNRTSGNQQVRSLVLYRWPRNDAYYIEGKNGVITDWREAMNNDYRWGVSGAALDADILEPESTVPTSMVAGETRDVVVRVLNKGTSTWGAGSAVRLGTLAANTVAWSQFQCGGYANGLADARAYLCADVAPGATGELRFKITAPASGPATFGARMVKDGVQWFGNQYTVAISISSAGCIQSVAAGHWKGEYFANTGLSGSPSLVRDDGAGSLAFEWGTGGPNSCGVGADRFSARWSRTMSLDAGTWRFTATADDGVRLYVDGQLKINAWIDQAPKSYTADVALVAGSHSVVMEYYENAGGATATLSWANVGGGAALDADILEAESVVPTSMVAGETRDVVVRVLNKGTSTWGAGSAVRLGTLVSNQVAWSQFQCGGYANGVADGRAFLCNDVAPGATAELRFKITAPANGPATFGARMVKDGVQWFGDQYTVAIAISSAGCIQSVVADHWKGEYFANVGLSGSASLVRDDGTGPLAFDWGTGGPNSCGVGADRFSARWSRTTSFDAGTYRFTATVDDGVRLYVDGQLKIDAWIDQAPKAYSADVVLAAGSHSIVMEYYENAGGAVASLAWTKVGGGATSSKLSLHSGGGALSMQFVSDTKPPVVKLLDNLSAAAEIKQRSPGTRVIARIYEASQPMDGDPGQRAQEWWNRNRDRILGAQAVDYWEGYNEPGVGTLAEVQWYAQFEAARVTILAANGRKACIGNFSTGTPDVNDATVWPAFYPAIDAAMAHGGILGLHEYGTPMQQYFEGDVASGLGWLCGRYRRVYQDFLIPGNRVIPLAVTETGVDGTCPGWRNCYNEAQYLGQLEWYDSVLRQDAYALGATIFQLEIPGWYAFDISPLMAALTQYVQRQQAPPPANRPPTATIDASPTSGVAPLVVQFDGSGSSDPDGDALTFSWSFGDGSQASVAQVSHTYGASGSFTATLTVGDGKGGNATTSTAISVISPPSGSLVTNGDFSQGLTGWTPWKERGSPTAAASGGQLRVSGSGYNGGVYQRFQTGGAGRTVTIGGFWATDPAVASAQWGEVLVINGTRLPVDGQDVADGQADVVLVYKNDTWASPSGWSGSMSQTAPVANRGSFVAAGGVATIVLKSGNVPGATSGVRFDDILVSNGGGGPANRPPTAVVSASPTSGPAPLTVQFDGSGSSDPDGDALSFAWSFGDGTQGSGTRVSHTYGADGSFTATLTVGDGKGGTGSQSVVIAVGSGPPAGVQWDDRLTRLGVTLVPATVAPGQGYWRLVKAQYEDDGEVLPGPCACSESGGNHHVYYKVLRADGTPIENQKCVADWPNPGPTYTADVYTKGADPLDDYWGNFPLTGHPSWCPYHLDGQGPRGIYGASVAGAPSDKVWGMDLPCSHHVNFRFTWQWTVAVAGALTPADPHLASFPRPKNDNGRGLHFVLDVRDSIVQHYAPFLEDMQIKWATVYGGDELQVTRAAKHLLDTYGIYSNLRVQDLVDRPKSADFYRALTELCLQQGIPPYVQIFNEPEDGREWEGSASTETFGYNWKARAEAVAQAGGYPGLQVLSKEFFDAAMAGVSDRVKQRMYFSLHNYGANHPPSYPYPQATVMEDDTAVLRFLEYANWFRSAIGFVPPMIGGEGGWLYQNHDDASMPAVTIDLWVPWHMEMFDWFRTGRLSNGEVLPDYLFSINPWLLYAANWYSDSWVDGLHADLKAELIQRLKDSPPYVRTFTGVR